MICQNCHEHEATVVITKLVGDEHTTKHLCKVCANQLDATDGGETSTQMEASGTASIDTCKTCGKSFSEFKKSGLFGCADCYTQFEAYLPKLFKRVQGVTSHVITQPVVPGDNLVLLEEELSQAVSCEDFEKAASIRDRLVTLRTPRSSAS